MRVVILDCFMYEACPHVMTGLSCNSWREIVMILKRMLATIVYFIGLSSREDGTHRLEQLLPMPTLHEWLIVIAMCSGVIIGSIR